MTLSVILYPYHILSVAFFPYHYHFVHTILSVPFCPLPFRPRTHVPQCGRDQIHSSTARIYIAPLQEAYSEALPTNSEAKWDRR